MSSTSLARDRNAFGFLRLLFAAMVVVSHVFAQIDGDTRRDPLIKLFGSITLGDVAVDGFFIISGFLVTKSFRHSPSFATYLVKRVLRIYPGFLACSVLLWLVVLPWGGGEPLTWHWGVITPKIKDALRLTISSNVAVFRTLPLTGLDASMWTINYEFRCYLLVAVASWVGFYRHRTFYALITGGLLILNALYRAKVIVYPFYGLPLLGATPEIVRLAGPFMVGGLFELYSDQIKLSRFAAIGCMTLMMFLGVTSLAEIIIATAGAYLIFYFALSAPALFKWGGDQTDISYGLYLYAWPIGQLLLYQLPDRRPAVVILETATLAAIAGALSWFLVEKPTKKLRLFRQRRPASVEHTAAPDAA